MPLYLCQPPTGYKDTADAWVNAGALVNRMNIGLQLASSQLRGVSIDRAALLHSSDSSARLAAARTTFVQACWAKTFRDPRSRRLPRRKVSRRWQR